MVHAIVTTAIKGNSFRKSRGSLATYVQLFPHLVFSVDRKIYSEQAFVFGMGA